MKKLVLLFAILPLGLLAQPDVVASGGNYNESSSVKISYTVGQSVIATVASNSAIATQGFQQPEYLITQIEEEGTQIELNIFPNPTSDNINLDFAQMPNGGVTVYLYDDAGKVVVSDKVVDTHYSIGMKDFPSGIYFLKVVGANSKKTYKILKK